MSITLSVCAYCERTAEEAQCDLVFVSSKGRPVLLCADCRGDRPEMTSDDLFEALYQPIDLPDGITAISHICPLVQYEGFSDSEATFIVELTEVEGDNYRYGHCSECGMTVRSRIV